MPISFANIPANIKVPLYWVEVDPSMAGLPTINLRALLVGIMTADGEAPPDVPLPIGEPGAGRQAIRQGSELVADVQGLLRQQLRQRGLGPAGRRAGRRRHRDRHHHDHRRRRPRPAPSISTSAATTCRSTSSPTDTVDEIATAIEAAINAEPTLPVTANAIAGAVTLTSVFKGVNGNDISVSLNYYGSSGGEETPVGLGITLPATGFLTGGAGVPDFDTPS